MSDQKIAIVVPENELGLFAHYDGQTSPQPVYLEIDPGERTATVDFSGEIGNAVPMDVYYDVRFRVRVPGVPLASAAREWLERDSIQALLSRACNGHSVAWDDYGNKCGTFTADAQEAWMELESELTAAIIYEMIAQVEICAAEDWLAPESLSEYGLSGVSTDAAIEDAAREITAAALSEGVCILERDMIHHLTNEIERAHEDN